ncbi:MAG TPA: hypothetical protein VF884_02020 [Nitrososphaeraceae archaeon]|jgi:hypothetical protein
MLGDTLFNMTLGMILGMAVCPLMMKAVKSIRQSIRVNRILREISEIQKAS